MKRKIIIALFVLGLMGCHVHAQVPPVAKNPKQEANDKAAGGPYWAYKPTAFAARSFAKVLASAKGANQEARDIVARIKSATNAVYPFENFYDLAVKQNVLTKKVIANVRKEYNLSAEDAHYFIKMVKTRIAQHKSILQMRFFYEGDTKGLDKMIQDTQANSIANENRLGASILARKAGQQRSIDRLNAEAAAIQKEGEEAGPYWTRKPNTFAARSFARTLDSAKGANQEAWDTMARIRSATNEVYPFENLHDLVVKENALTKEVIANVSNKYNLSKKDADDFVRRVRSRIYQHAQIVNLKNRTRKNYLYEHIIKNRMQEIMARIVADENRREVSSLTRHVRQQRSIDRLNDKAAARQKEGEEAGPYWSSKQSSATVSSFARTLASARGANQEAWDIMAKIRSATNEVYPLENLHDPVVKKNALTKEVIANVSNKYNLSEEDANDFVRRAIFRISQHAAIANLKNRMRKNYLYKHIIKNRMQEVMAKIVATENRQEVYRLAAKAKKQRNIDIAPQERVRLTKMLQYLKQKFEKLEENIQKLLDKKREEEKLFSLFDRMLLRKLENIRMIMDYPTMKRELEEKLRRAQAEVAQLAKEREAQEEKKPKKKLTKEEEQLAAQIERMRIERLGREGQIAEAKKKKTKEPPAPRRARR